MNRFRVRWAVGCLLILFLGRHAAACLWDSDTLAMERRAFPGILELITGKFLRHSTEFYQWRIKDRLARIEQTPDDLALYDDLAVAYDKTGDHAKAIETMKRKQALKPGLYETAANLGTFYIHDGQFDAGLPYLKQAIEINPDAHFGREIYQVLLVEYVLKRKRDNAALQLPMREGLRKLPVNPWGEDFADFVLRQRPTDDPQSEIQAAIKGVSGMMRFGNYAAPVLLEALGDLLSYDFQSIDPKLDSKRMAARCYLRASQLVENGEARKLYHELARATLHMQLDDGATQKELSLETVELRLQAEQKEADTWYAGVRTNELKWIANGSDVDQEFSRKYYREPAVSNSSAGILAPDRIRIAATVSLVVALVALVVLGMRFWFRRHRIVKAQAVST